MCYNTMKSMIETLCCYSAAAFTVELIYYSKLNKLESYFLQGSFITLDRCPFNYFQVSLSHLNPIIVLIEIAPTFQTL